MTCGEAWIPMGWPRPHSQVARAALAAQIQPPCREEQLGQGDKTHTQVTCEILVIFLCFCSNIILHMRLGNILSDILSYLYSCITCLQKRNGLLLLS